MIEKLLFVDEILGVITIFILGFFCAVVPKINIMKYLYILFGITIIQLGIDCIVDGDVWYEYIWYFLFAAIAITVGIWLLIASKAMTKEEQEALDQDFEEISRRSGKRKILTLLLKMIK
jgi:hypothetical protein